MAVVTIRGPMGSGAPEIGRFVAGQLRGGYIDREIIAQVAARLDRKEEEVIAKEKPATGLLDRIAEALGHSYVFGDGVAGAYLPVAQIPLDDTRYLRALESVIRELAQNQPLVILGRGSHFILKDHPGVFHVLAVAPLEVRIRRVMEDLKIDRESAKAEISRFDSSVREFVKRYFKAEIEDPEQYDLVINTKHFTFQACASIIVNSLSLKSR